MQKIKLKNSKLHPALFKKVGVCVCVIAQLTKQMRGIYNFFLDNVTPGTWNKRAEEDILLTEFV